MAQLNKCQKSVDMRGGMKGFLGVLGVLVPGLPWGRVKSKLSSRSRAKAAF